MPRPVAAMMLGACLALLAIGLGLGALRVHDLETSELAHEGELRSLRSRARDPGSTAVSARLSEVHLQAGEKALFEVCAEDGLPPDRWRHALELAVFQLEPMGLLLRVPLDDAHLERVERNADGGCLPLGSGVIEQAGRYSVDAVWPDGRPPEAVLSTPIQARVLARKPLSGLDRLLVATIALAALLLVALASLPNVWLPEPRARAADPHVAAWPVVVYAWVAFAVLAVLATSLVPLGRGATLGLTKGLLIAAVQVVAVLAFASRRHAPLPVARPVRPRRHLLAGALACPLLVANAKLSLSLVPSTAEAPIQTFIAWPSGMLAFALLGAVLPLAEELFFRGFIYGALLRLGRAWAFTLTVLLFAALHAQQSWGNWGALWAIFGTGIVLTALRAMSGSILPGALAHTLYNLVLSLRSW